MAVIDLSKIDLRKQSVIDLKKSSGLGADSKAQVYLALDFSGSMGSMYYDGTVQDVVERILPFGLAFDDNGEVDFYLFHDGYKKLPENITLGNLEGYVEKKIMNKYSMGGTNYAPVLEAIYKEVVPVSGGGFFSKSSIGQMDMPVYVIFITDGNNFDKIETENIIRKLSNAGVFVQFIGIGRERFSFLEKLDDLSGRKIDNVNFFKVDDIRGIPDNTLYQGLMAEYPDWVKQAKTHNLIK